MSTRAEVSGLGGAARELVPLFANLVQRGAVFFALGLLIVATLAIEPRLLSADGIALLLRQVSAIALVALGQTIVMLVRGIDLSVGSVVGVVNWTAAGLLAGSGGDVWVIPLCIALGLGIGAISGLGVAGLGLPPFVMTLGMLFAVQGGGLTVTGGVAEGSPSPFLRGIVSETIVVLPVSFVLVLAFYAAGYAVLRRGVYGRWVYAVGANPRAAHVGGVPVKRTLMVAYMASGALAACGGLIWTGFIGSAQITAGRGFEFESIAAAAIGGTALTGGRGGVMGTLGGVLFLGLLFNLLVVVGVDESFRRVLSGATIVIAAALYSWKASR